MQEQQVVVALAVWREARTQLGVQRSVGSITEGGATADVSWMYCKVVGTWVLICNALLT